MAAGVIASRSTGSSRQNLVSGQTVAVRVARGTTRGVILPETAIVPAAEGDILYIEVQKGVFAPRRVRVAARFGGKVRVVSGVEAGEKVVVRGGMALRGESLRSQLQDTG